MSTITMAEMLASLRIVPAALSCLFAGLVLAGLLTAALRRWPVLAARRAVWLSGQLALAAVFFLTLIPQSARLSVLPALVLIKPDYLPTQRAPSQAPAQAPSSASPTPPQASAPTADGQASRFDDFLKWLPACTVLAYCVGVLWQLLSALRARQLLRALFCASRRLSSAQLRLHDAFCAADIAALEQHGLSVWETDAAISPMLTGVRKPRLLLPLHLRSFSQEQQQLIVLHELTHWRRGDPLYQALGQALRIALWFNPALRWLGDKLSWAQELACDEQVLAGRPQRERQSYAAALVRQLKLQVAAPGGMSASASASALAFGGIDASTMAARVTLMRQTAVAQVGTMGKGLLGAGLGLVVLASVLLQPAFAWLPPTPARAAFAVSASLTARPWSYPLDNIKVISFYGIVSELLPDGHHGIDLAAKKGTPIHAVAAGVVTVGNDARLGNFVAIDHDGQRRSLYAHLDTLAVIDGQRVVAGQTIGKVGQTGMATGPHLHFEVFRDGHRVDPQTMLAGLDQRATPRALRVRKAQFGR